MVKSLEREIADQELEHGAWNEVNEDYYVLPLEGDAELTVILGEKFEIHYDFPSPEAEADHETHYTETVKVVDGRFSVNINVDPYGFVAAEEQELNAAASRAVKLSCIPKYKELFRTAKGLTPSVRRKCISIINDLNRENYISEGYNSEI